MKPWFRHYVGATRDPKFKRVAMRTGQRLGDVIYVWDTLEESASEVDDGGAYRVDPADIAYELRCEPEAIAEILGAFEAEDVRLIGGGIITKWAERQFESDSSALRVKAHREKARAGGVVKVPFDATLQSRYGNGDVTPSESETDLETKPSSVVVPFPGAGAAGATDDDEVLISDLKKIFGAKALDKALRAAPEFITGWIREGCDFSADVRPELVEIAGKLRHPLKSFGAGFIARQVLARRDLRLAGGAARSAIEREAASAEAKVFVPRDGPQWALCAARYSSERGMPPPDYATGGSGKKGWSFPAEWLARDGPEQAAAPDLGERRAAQ